MGTGLATVALACSLAGSPSEDGTSRGHGWSTDWILGGALIRPAPIGPDSRMIRRMIGVNELGIGFSHALVGRFSLSFAIGGAVFHHRLQTRAIRREVGLWTDVALRRDLLGWGRLQPFAAVHLHGRWFDPIESHMWTLMGGVGPALGLELRFNERAGLLAQGEAFWEAVAAERERGRLRGIAMSFGARIALSVHY